MFNANAITRLIPQNFIGVFELDSTGMVVYCGARNDDKSGEAKLNLVGRNFFEEIAAFQNGAEFRRRFNRFRTDSFTTDSFNFSFDSGEPDEKFRVKLVRVCERDYRGNTDLVIVDIRKN